MGSTDSAVKSPEDIILIRTNGCVVPVSCDEIAWAKSEDNYVRLGLTEGEFFVRRTLSDLEQRLAPGPFVRIHRSTLINFRYVKRLVPWFSGGYVVELITGEEFKLSKGYAAELFNRFGSP